MKYLGNTEVASKKWKEQIFKAVDKNLPEVLSFLESYLEVQDFSLKAQMQISLAAEEIFVNIAHYAYGPEGGSVTVRVEWSAEPPGVRITFMDRGRPYNPLEKEDPDLTLSAEDRPIGGLGIFLTRKVMDDISYEYKDGQNRLTMIKKGQTSQERR